jgi:uncharacterized protein YkwD
MGSMISSRTVVTVAFGVLLGVSVVAGMRTAGWWGARIPGLPHHDGTMEPTRADIPPCGKVPSCLNVKTLSIREQEMLSLVAGERQQAGCSTVYVDSRLQKAAQARAADLAAGAPLSHVDADQRTPRDHARAHGYDGRVLESLAVGINDPQSVMRRWLHPQPDPTLRTRIDDCRSQAIGLGYSDAARGDSFDRGIWVLLLGRLDTT